MEVLKKKLKSTLINHDTLSWMHVLKSKLNSHNTFTC